MMNTENSSIITVGYVKVKESFGNDLQLPIVEHRGVRFVDNSHIDTIRAENWGYYVALTPHENLVVDINDCCRDLADKSHIENLVVEITSVGRTIAKDKCVQCLIIVGSKKVAERAFRAAEPDLSLEDYWWEHNDPAINVFKDMICRHIETSFNDLNIKKCVYHN